MHLIRDLIDKFIRGGLETHYLTMEKLCNVDPACSAYTYTI